MCILTASPTVTSSRALRAIEIQSPALAPPLPMPSTLAPPLLTPRSRRSLASRLRRKNIFVDFGDAIKLGDFGLASGDLADKPPVAADALAATPEDALGAVADVSEVGGGSGGVSPL